VIVDSSAIVAILRREPEEDYCKKAIENAAVRRISAVNFVEAAIVIDASHDPILSREFDELCFESELIIEPVTEEQARVARDAYRDFGKSSGHPAQLNLGDSFAYALAKTMREPLLYKGNDFAQTDVPLALP
jgi:ribonuclease VapC